MKFEVVEQSGAWIVRRDGVELARFDAQHHALVDVSERLRALQDAKGAVSLAMRYEARPE
ncbi:MAG: hypothetical protein JWQ29_3002 [Phenylobacterium sp.]|nr:hypothetical protein [Phenylobacterium sp.]